MPSAKYDEAFALLEQSFKDANFLQAYKALPSRQTTEEADSPDHSDTSDDDDSDYSDASMHEGYGTRDHPPMSLTRTNSTLPPTPPTLQRDANPVHPHLVPLPKEQSGVSTPLNQQGPLTPDLTPPNTRDRDLAVPRPAMPHYPSSRAESFITAKESQSQPSAHTSQSSLLLRSPRAEAGGKWLDATRGMRLGGMQLGLTDPRRQFREDTTSSGDATPTQETERSLGSSGMVEYITPQDLDRSNSSTPESAGANVMRNVTIRKKRAHKPQPQTSRKDEMSAGDGKSSQPLAMPQSESSTESPSTVKDGENLDWPEIANDHLYRHMRDQKAKRLSGASQASTVIEAVVRAAPIEPQKQPALRRVSKHDTLRSGASSKRSSIDSVASSMHQLRHRKAPLPGRIHMVNEVDSIRAFSNPETGSQSPVIAMPERRSSPVGRRQDIRLLTLRQNRLYRPKPNPSLLREFRGSESLYSRVDGDPTAHDRSWLDDASPDPIQQQSRAKLRHVSAPMYTNGSSKDTFRRINGTDAKLHLGPRQGWKRHSLDAELESPEREQPSRPSVASIQASEFTPERNPSSSIKANPSTQAGLEYSTQSSPRRSSDWKDARQLHPSFTPASQISDRSMEVNEAKAINLYPHENKSLLMVQHGAKKRMAELDDAAQPRPIDDIITPPSEDETSSRPVFHAVIDAPETPPMSDEPHLDVDSPLRNPRAAPQPPRLPVINFIPATPFSEIEQDPPAEEPTRPEPVRRPSLVEKARRYSESLIQPFLPRTMSRRSTSSQRPQSSEDRDTTLHPFWRPRGFWDGFESEDDDYEDEPLPRGGDTSDVRSIESAEEKQQSMWSPRRLSVRLPGFRGQGGFLMGNSLGIDRHGTNVRRPYVTLPPALRRRKENTTSTSVETNEARPSVSRSSSSFLRLLPTLRKRKSTDLLRAAAQSTESLRRLAQRQKRRRFREWDSRYGVAGLRKKMSSRRERKEEAERERLREEMKGRIGSPVYVET